MSYEGWTDRQTWYVYIMMGNERKYNDLTHKIVRGALDRTLYKAPGSDRPISDEAIYQTVAKLFAKYFRPIRNLAMKEFDEKLQDTLTERGEFEARQIEGKKPPPSEHGHIGDVLNEAMDLIRSDMGSGPLPVWKEPNWLELAEWEVEEEKLQRRSAEAAERMTRKPGEDVELPPDMVEGLKEMNIKAALEGQCDCESLFCEEAGDHRAGRCPRPSEHLARAFGLKAKLCGQCTERWRQTAGTDMRIVGSKEASMEVTINYTVKGKKASSTIKAGSAKRFIRLATDKWGDDFKAEPITSGISKVDGPKPEKLKQAGDNMGGITPPDVDVLSAATPAPPKDNSLIDQKQSAKKAGFNFFFPGQALREFYPEIQHELVDYPNATNAPMDSAISGNSLGGPDYTGNEAKGPDYITAAFDGMLDRMGKLSFIDAGPNVSTSPAAGAGLGNDIKSGVLEGSPFKDEGEIRNQSENESFYRYRGNEPPGGAFRKENQDRGGMFEEEFYQNYGGAPEGDALTVLSSEMEKDEHPGTDKHETCGKCGQCICCGTCHCPEPHRTGKFWEWDKKSGHKTAAMGDAKEKFGAFLKRVMAEVAATFISAYKVTSRPPLDKIPGMGEVQLDQIEQQQMQGSTSGFVFNTTTSRVKNLVQKLTDSDIQECINDAWAQAAVWCSSPGGGFVYEVFARAETLDSESLTLKYKFVTGTRDSGI